MRLSIILLSALCLLSFAASAEEPEPVAYPGSTRVTFASADQQNGVPVTISGWWLKSSQTGKRPTVIALHGCGGLYSTRKLSGNELTARHAGMTEILHDAGYNVLLPDSFTMRGKRSICTEKISTRDITSENRRGDVAGAMNWLATQSDVDASRIVLLGWSHGGSTVLSAVDGGRADLLATSVQLKAAVAFYPGCSTSLKSRTPYRLISPLLILMGANDDWTPPAPCIELDKQLTARGDPIMLRLYEDSYHDFDAPGMALRVRKDVPNGVKHGQGVTTGGNAVARAAAYKEMLAFLETQFR